MRIWQVSWRSPASDANQLAWFTTKVNASKGIDTLKAEFGRRTTFGCEAVEVPTNKKALVAWLNRHVIQEARIGRAAPGVPRGSIAQNAASYIVTARKKQQQ